MDKLTLIQNNPDLEKCDIYIEYDPISVIPQPETVSIFKLREELLRIDKSMEHLITVKTRVIGKMKAIHDDPEIDITLPDMDDLLNTIR